MDLLLDWAGHDCKVEEEERLAIAVVLVGGRTCSSRQVVELHMRLS